MRRLIPTIAFLWLTAGFAGAQGVQLQPYKDALFAYPAVLESVRGGAYLRVAYDELRDINGRDTIPKRKVQSKYVDRSVRWSRRVRSYRSPNGTFKTFAVGKHRGGAKVTVIFLHGKNGNRRLGVNDWTFGGNFNRLQNLMVRNDGLMLSPDFSDFGERGTRDIAALIRTYRERSPSTRVFVACGSMGGGVCWRLASDAGLAQNLSGLFLLGSHWSDAFLASPVAQGKVPAVPLYFGHGGADPVFRPSRQRAFFERILAQNPNYPARFVMFDTGSHGTPIRMVDWRRELNWMLSLGR